MAWSRSDLLAGARALKARYPELRFGQALYNYAYSMNPAVAHLAGTEVDPFHLNERVELFLSTLCDPKDPA